MFISDRKKPEIKRKKLIRKKVEKLESSELTC